MQPSDQVTAPLSPAQRARVDALLDDMFDLPEGERIANLRARRIEDTAVLAEVESLLRAASASGGFLSIPPSLPRRNSFRTVPSDCVLVHGASHG